MKLYLKKNYHLLVLAVIILLGLLVRSQTFLTGDFYFLIDQGRDMLLAQQVVIDHKLMLIGARAGFGGLFHGPLWIYLITPFFILSKGNPFLTLAPLYTLLTISLIVAGYGVGSKLYGRTTGLILAFFLATSQSLISDAQFTTNAHLMPLIFLGYVGSVLLYLRGIKRASLGMFFCAGLGFQSEPAFAIVLLPVSLIVLIFGSKKPSLIHLLSAAILYLLPLMTFIFFDLRHELLMTKSVLKLFISHSEPLKGYEAYADIFYRVQDRLLLLMSSFKMPLFTDNLLLTVLIGGVLCWGFILLVRKGQQLRREYLFLLGFQITIFVTYIFYPFPLWSHYLLALVVTSSLLVAISIKVISKQKYGTAIVVLFLCLAVLAPSIWLVHTYVVSPTLSLASDGSYKNQQEVVTWMYDDANGKSFGYFVYTSGTLTYNMDYLVRLESLKRGTPSPQNKKEPLTYLILYPSSDKNSQNFWKKHVLHTASVPVVTKFFEGGISIQKLRILEPEEAVDPNYSQNLLFR